MYSLRWFAAEIAHDWGPLSAARMQQPQHVSRAQRVVTPVHACVICHSGHRAVLSSAQGQPGLLQPVGPHLLRHAAAEEAAMPSMQPGVQLDAGQLRGPF